MGGYNLLTAEQLNFNNWERGRTSYSCVDVYANGINTVTITGDSSWEDYHLGITVTPNTNYVFTFGYNAPSGYSAYGYESRRAYIWDSTWTFSNSAINLSDSRLIGYTDTWLTSASATPTEYSVSFNSGNNTTIYIQFGFADIRDGNPTVMIWRDLQLRKA